MPELQSRAAEIVAGLTFRLVLMGLVVLLVVNTYADIRIPLPLLPDIRFEGWKPKAQRLAAEKRGCEARLHTSNASIGTLEGVIRWRNAEIAQRAAEYAAAKAQTADRQADLARLAASSNARIARLREVAERTAVSGQCETPAELRELAEGL